jgi:hypothetical protein
MWLAFTTNPHLLDTAVAIDGWMKKREGSADVGLATICRSCKGYRDKAAITVGHHG